MDTDKYSFAQCNHAWLLILALPEGETEPATFVLEATNGNLYFAGDAEDDTKILRYLKGYYYTKPSDLRNDLKDRW